MHRCAGFAPDPDRDRHHAIVRVNIAKIRPRAAPEGDGNAPRLERVRAGCARRCVGFCGDRWRGNVGTGSAERKRRDSSVRQPQQRRNPHREVQRLREPAGERAHPESAGAYRGTGCPRLLHGDGVRFGRHHLLRSLRRRRRGHGRRLQRPGWAVNPQVSEPTVQLSSPFREGWSAGGADVTRVHAVCADHVPAHP